MPLLMRVKRNRWTCPVIICDRCNKEITDAREGTVLWRLDDDTNLPVDEPTTFVHKQCDEGAYRDVGWRWMPLADMLTYLERGLKLEGKRSRQTMEERIASA